MRRVPLAWIVAAGFALLGMALGAASGRALSVLLWLAILACPLLHLLGGHGHGSGQTRHADGREKADHPHGPSPDGGSETK